MYIIYIYIIYIYIYKIYIYKYIHIYNIHIYIYQYIYVCVYIYIYIYILYGIDAHTTHICSKFVDIRATLNMVDSDRRVVRAPLCSAAKRRKGEIGHTSGTDRPKGTLRSPEDRLNIERQ